MLYETTIGGETRKVVANFSRNGFYYTLDRTSGQFLRADQYQEKVSWTKGIDQKTGKRSTMIRPATCSSTPGLVRCAASPARRLARGGAPRPRSFRRASTPSA